MSDLLIIFVKNPVLGKVKTRLARDIGDEQALQVYHKLLQHTQAITHQLNCTKWVFYSDYIDQSDDWSTGYEKHLQSGEDLGKRMHHAFRKGFDARYKRICIIGSDCWELTPQHINQAFHQLHDHDFSIGPARDGGYYLLGMTQLLEELFIDKRWSTSDVLTSTLEDVRKAGKSIHMLEELSDIDHQSDLDRYPDLI